jgi:16S rRNA (adenine1518-N6/adenine1519-N6)-dimethyltransferase
VRRGVAWLELVGRRTSGAPVSTVGAWSLLLPLNDPMIAGPDKDPASQGQVGSPPVLRLRKSLGQHLLVSPGVLDEIVRSAEITPDDLVVEVGPGTGLLTARLAGAAREVVAVELDPAMAQRTRHAIGEQNSVSVIEGDILKQDPSALTAGRPYLVVANLPYNIASPTVRMFLEGTHAPRRMVITVQREVAQEMCAPPGQLGMLGLSVQVYASARIVRRVAPGSFRPPPKVESAVVRLEVLDQPLIRRDALKGFFRVARAGFSTPRKQLRNSLARGLDIASTEIERLLNEAGIDPTRRPQTLTISEWGKLTDLVAGQRAG